VIALSGSSGSRRYQMSKRAEDVAQTRQRIVEAAVHLHGTVGPAATTISALAEAAGVTRLTVYRHFADDSELFAACSQHWAASQRLPDARAWSQLADPWQRLQVGLSDLYRFYREAEPMLARVRRDRASIPPEILQRTDETERRYRDTLLERFDVHGRPRRRVRALLGHAVSFWTWRSLCIDQGLSSADAVQAMSDLIATTASAKCGDADPARNRGRRSP
jgi:AcrR family transcriptional regulator